MVVRTILQRATEPEKSGTLPPGVAKSLWTSLSEMRKWVKGIRAVVRKLRSDDLQKEMKTSYATRFSSRILGDRSNAVTVLKEHRYD